LKRPIEPGFNSIGHPSLNSTQIIRPGIKQNGNISSNSSLSSVRSSGETNSGHLFSVNCINSHQHQQQMSTQQMMRLDSFDQAPDQTSMMAKVNLFKSRTLLNDQSNFFEAGDQNYCYSKIKIICDV